MEMKEDKEGGRSGKKITEKMNKVEKTPMKRRQPDGRGKKTPISLRKVGRSTLVNSRTRKVSVAGVGERGKMAEGLRLGLAIANNKVGNNTKKLIEKLENARGESKWVVEDASPPHRLAILIRGLIQFVSRTSQTTCGLSSV